MRVLIADDHSLFRDGICSLLQAAGFEVVGGVGNGQEAVDAVTRLQPELVLMDINMPVMNGLEAVRQIKQIAPPTRVVMLTVSDDDRALVEAIKAGASGYLLKNLNANEFLSMLDGVQRGESAMARATLAKLLDNLSDFNRERESEPELTAREVELLNFVAQGLSNKAIAQQMSISTNTVKYHMKGILQKLAVQNRAEAVAKALRIGVLENNRA